MTKKQFEEFKKQDIELMKGLSKLGDKFYCADCGTELPIELINHSDKIRSRFIKYMVDKNVFYRLCHLCYKYSNDKI